MPQNSKSDPLFKTAKQLILDTKNPTISLLQKHMFLGYSHAENLIQAMEGDIVAPRDHQGCWKMLIGETYDTSNDPLWDLENGWIWEAYDTHLDYAHITVECLSKRGVGKACNEDAIMLPGLVQRGAVREHGRLHVSKPHYLAIADGVSTSEASQIASMGLLCCLKSLLHEAQTNESIAEVLHLLQKKFAAKYEESKYFGAASTLVGVRLIGNSATIFNVGDSRAYLLTHCAEGCKAQLLSRDHNLLNDMLDDGEITPEEAKNAASVYRGLTSQFIADPAYDELQVNVVTHTLQKGERLLLCSDGLNEVLSDTEIAALFAENSEETLIKAYMASRRAGGVDDFSVIVIEAKNFYADWQPK